MFDKIDDDLIKQLIEETCELVEEELKAHAERSQAKQASDEHEEHDDKEPNDKQVHAPASKDASAKNLKSVFKKPIGKAISHRQNAKGVSVQEAVLEFIQREDGKLILQELGDDEPMVSIEFSDKVIAMIGKEHLQSVGQAMIQAAISSVMHRQMNAWHAHVYDEEPVRYS